MQEVFVTGGTGYIGPPLITELLARGHKVRALVRRRSETRIPTGTVAVYGDALDAESFTSAIPPAATLVHLAGTRLPNPSKVRQFREVDLASIEAAARAGVSAAVRQLVYVSAAQPAPVMRAYIAARQHGEAIVSTSRLNATILRP
ncbi:MAG: NAD(P)H-binding protein [Gammaproteobacteria bacterium]|nr:NAD(P)H-binding protein [Gammaproteobacteria bacterium]